MFFLLGESCSRRAETHGSLSGWSIRGCQSPRCSCTAESLFLHQYVQKPVAQRIQYPRGYQIGLHVWPYIKKTQTTTDTDVSVVSHQEMPPITPKHLQTSSNLFSRGVNTWMNERWLVCTRCLQMGPCCHSACSCFQGHSCPQRRVQGDEPRRLQGQIPGALLLPAGLVSVCSLLRKINTPHFCSCFFNAL